MKFVCPEEATPIDADDASALIPGHITTQRELNEWENQNIKKATVWGVSRKRSDLLSLSYVKELHRRMFDETWAWAGRFRQTDKNIGVAWEQVPVEVRKLMDDAQLWLRESTFSIGESAIRLHYRMVGIHPFPNGNGRHARLFADILLFNHDLPRIDWGKESLDFAGTTRERYINALRAADKGDFSQLLSYIQK
jgi:Fic-DOC domain mobile mystery protein B